ncbi:hypothetical protein AB0H88_42190 [Nonomuraea sp. NPDC050680]|uniref:hypothetical protein n=1 Tax=Nonomuraea sp. NPDC050680 TaxID=3154630 RepID=UPI0033EAE2D1
MAKLDGSPYPEDLDSELAVQPRKPLSKVTLALIAGVVLVAGVVIGIQAQKALGAPATAAAMQPGGRQLPGGYGQQGRQPGGYGQQPGGRQQMPGGYGQRMGGAGGGTVGTVEKVEGGKIYVKTMDGSTVTVTTTEATTVQVTKPGKLADLRAGTNVVVRGEKGGDGSVAATSISQGGVGR